MKNFAHRQHWRQRRKRSRECFRRHHHHARRRDVGRDRNHQDARGASADEAREILALVQVDIVERGTRRRGYGIRRATSAAAESSQSDVRLFNIAAPELCIIAKSISATSGPETSRRPHPQTVSGGVASSAPRAHDRPIDFRDIRIVDTRSTGRSKPAISGRCACAT